MNKIADVRRMGTIYDVTVKGELMARIQLVTSRRILDAALGDYVGEKHGTFASYMKKSVKKLSNFEDVDYGRIMWATPDEANEIDVPSLVRNEYTGGFDTVIIEERADADIVNT